MHKTLDSFGHYKTEKFAQHKQSVRCTHKLFETLPTINNQITPKRGRQRNKVREPTSKKTNEPPKRANHKRNVKFPNFLLL